MSDIAYQNKDITLKYFADTLIDKSLAVYGLPHIRIKDCRPTNLPAIEANELRLDNLFSLRMDHGSQRPVACRTERPAVPGKPGGLKDVVKYVNYIARILKCFISLSFQQISER